MKAINLDTFSLSLLTAKEDILNGRASTDWALFAYDGFTNNLKLFDSGAGGLSELAQKFHIAKPMYGLCRITQPEVEQPRVVLICWVGEDVDEYRKTECASHVPAVKNFFKEAHVFINASDKDELTEEKIAAVLEKVRPPMERYRRHSRPTDKEATVGTNYRKTNAAMEMRRINRDSFWARAEREEEERKEEEKRRATEDRRRRERERVQQERRDAEERDRRMNEKLQMIEEQKRLDAKRQEEAKRREKSRWEMQQKEHEDEMRARLKRSESIEKAAEAAALISQRSMNPREFFRQLSQSSTSPVSPRTGKPPFRRYQRSLTDTAFIFEKASASSGPTSPLSPSVTSPFSRTPTSPFNRCMSPTSPGFRPITSPQSPRAPVRSPSSSPIECSAPPMSVLPSLPESSAPPPQSSLPDLPAAQASAVSEPSCVVDSLIECSAPPPVSSLPSLPESKAPPPQSSLPNLPPAQVSTVIESSGVDATLIECFAPPPVSSLPNLSDSKAPPPQSSLPDLPPAQVSTVIESSSVDATLIECFAPPVSFLPNMSDSKAPPPQSSLPDLPAAQVSAVTESSSVVESQSSSVDVSEQEAVAVPDAPSAPLPDIPILFKELLVDTSMPSETEEELNIVVGPEVEVTLPLESCSSYLPDIPYSCQDIVEAKEVVMPRSEPVAVFPVIEVEEIIEEEELEQEEAEETAEFVLIGEQPELETSANDAATLVEAIVADVREDAEVCVEETKDFVIEEERPDQNGVCPQNGTAKEYDDSSDQSTPERCTYIVNRVEAEDDEDVQNEEAENGESSGDRPLLRVRALYDYQAEDDTEISFKPGDIIMDVETVDTAWWKGCSKDGRQGLFPSNYVETI